MEPRVLKSLLKTAAYPEPTSAVHLIQTHVSYIFLTDSFVYKVKKGVDFGFLNFSTMDRRRFYCEEEVRLNNRLSPDLYVGVVEVRETGTGASFSGSGRVIDYAVKMRRLPEEKMLHRLVDAGTATESQMVHLADVIARFHLAAETGEEFDKYGSSDFIHGNWEENFRMAKDFINFTLSATDIRLMEKWVNLFIEENKELFLTRIRERWIRECDGDLHMQNMCIVDERIYIFDCIEFNERFRYSDTAADVAFLAMDLDYHHREDLRDVFLDAYEERIGDTSFRQLLNFYKAYRAFVRGKVESLKALDSAIAEPERREAQKEAAQHFRLARRYTLVDRIPPTLIITCGLMGSGKSFLAKNLSFDLGVPVVRTDAVRKSLFPEAASGASNDFHAGLYSPDAVQKTYEAAFLATADLLNQGKSVIVDAAFSSGQQRQRFRELALAQGAEFHILKVSCPEKIAKKRLLQRAEEKSDVSDGRWDLYHLQEREFSMPASEDPSVVEIDTTRPEAEIATAILNRMGLIR